MSKKSQSAAYSLPISASMNHIDFSKKIELKSSPYLYTDTARLAVVDMRHRDTSASEQVELTEAPKKTKKESKGAVKKLAEEAHLRSVAIRDIDDDASPKSAFSFTTMRDEIAQKASNDAPTSPLKTDWDGKLREVPVAPSLKHKDVVREDICTTRAQLIDLERTFNKLRSITNSRLADIEELTKRSNKVDHEAASIHYNQHLDPRPIELQQQLNDVSDNFRLATEYAKQLEAMKFRCERTREEMSHSLNQRKVVVEEHIHDIGMLQLMADTAEVHLADHRRELSNLKKTIDKRRQLYEKELEQQNRRLRITTAETKRLEALYGEKVQSRSQQAKALENMEMKPRYDLSDLNADMVKKSRDQKFENAFRVFLAHSSGNDASDGSQHMDPQTVVLRLADQRHVKELWDVAVADSTARLADLTKQKEEMEKRLTHLKTCGDESTSTQSLTSEHESLVVRIAQADLHEDKIRRKQESMTKLIANAQSGIIATCRLLQDMQIDIKIPDHALDDTELEALVRQLERKLAAIWSVVEHASSQQSEAPTQAASQKPAGPFRMDTSNDFVAWGQLPYQKTNNVRIALASPRRIEEEDSDSDSDVGAEAQPEARAEMKANATRYMHSKSVKRKVKKDLDDGISVPRHYRPRRPQQYRVAELATAASARPRPMPFDPRPTAVLHHSMPHSMGGEGAGGRPPSSASRPRSRPQSPAMPYLPRAGAGNMIRPKSSMGISSIERLPAQRPKSAMGHM